ncbi:thiamine biosynthesis protein ThiF [Lichenihabitans sp. Uapishka_5]|uniref:thiamine biosynthesis protein ThiF n=1 Tax=Lichenihabitans sp. Uapishka_5 TaxID=3037302 RepID=UPI0029E7D5CB|nr:thiamine biosynthesis protein ThiF [Lichenihabitans sp. Uapishka_5]MDX7951818.1 thiamine biosynthesis protein ThiF [Lichenihabitans sp. Uapishka_5]
MPPAVTRAIRIACAHPAVLEVRVSEDAETGIIQMDLNIQQELPSAWRAAGESPSHVRAVETAIIRFPPSYPQRPPRTYLREDFDRTHPHLLPGPSDQLPQPCVVNGYPSELIQARGFEGYLDQLVDWLDKAAMLELNSEQHGWEPVRRYHVDDEIIAAPVPLRGMSGPGGDCAVVRTEFIRFELGEGRRLFRIALNLGQHVALDRAGCTITQTGERVFRGCGVALIVGAPDREGSSTIIGTPLPESVATVDGLLERARHYGCESALKAKLDHIGLMLAQGGFTATPLVIVFLVRRPFRVVGSDSPIEIRPYVLDLQPGEGLLLSRGDVRLCGLREEITTALMRRAAGDDEGSPSRPWLLLGCGSVGSKIALHLARRGQGPARVLDRAMMSPHNYARHGLLPEPNARGGLIIPKAEALTHSLAGFHSPADAELTDIGSLVTTVEGRQRFDVDGLVLNTTGSSAVRETLVSQAWEKRPPFGEAHLLGAGAVAYAAFEGAGGNPSLSDLAAESYRLIAADADIRDQVFGAQAEAIQIGQGCGTRSCPWAWCSSAA